MNVYLPLCPLCLPFPEKGGRLILCCHFMQQNPYPVLNCGVVDEGGRVAVFSWVSLYINYFFVLILEKKKKYKKELTVPIMIVYTIHSPFLLSILTLW